MSSKNPPSLWVGSRSDSHDRPSIELEVAEAPVSCGMFISTDCPQRRRPSVPSAFLVTDFSRALEVNVL